MLLEWAGMRIAWVVRYVEEHPFDEKGYEAMRARWKVNDEEVQKCKEEVNARLRKAMEKDLWVWVK